MEEVNKKEVKVVKPIVKEVVKHVDRWTGDFNHFNKEYKFISTKGDGLVEIFIKNTEGKYEWCEVEFTDSRIDSYLLTDLCRTKFE